jgi:NAD(P)H-flavin reductase
MSPSRQAQTGEFPVGAPSSARRWRQQPRSEARRAAYGAFYRVDDDRNRDGGDAGLGLAWPIRVIYLLGSNPALLTSESLRRLVPGLKDRDVYLCGPPRLADAVREAVRDLGLPSSQLHEERFAF